MTEPTLAISVTRTLLATAERCGLDPTALVREVGLDPAVFEGVDGRLPVRVHIELFARARELSGRSDFALEVGRSFRPGTLHGVGQVAMNAGTLREAWTHLARYWRLVAEGTAFRVEPREDGTFVVAFEQEDPVLPFPRDGFESVAVGQVSFARWLTHRPLHPRQVRLPFEAPSHRQALSSFFEAPVEYGAARAETIWDRDAVELPVVEAVPEVMALVERRLEALLRRLEGRGDAAVVSRVRAAIIKALPAEEPTAHEVAQALALSQRSLQRRLSEAGTSFTRLVDETRRGLTMQLLDDASLPIEEVAFLAGFSETRAFYRAFRRWTGTTPGKWRATRK